MAGMPHDLVRPPKARRGDRVAVLSPSFAAAGAFPAVHEQAHWATPSRVTRGYLVRVNQ
jgi:hypothetical protein